jgi:uncharacterized protein (DUF2147 family)
MRHRPYAPWQPVLVAAATLVSASAASAQAPPAASTPRSSASPQFEAPAPKPAQPAAAVPAKPAAPAPAKQAAVAQPAGPPETGVWFDDTGKGAVEIRPCTDSGGAQGQLCGRIVWLKEPNNDKGQPLTDGNNPEPEMRARPICGLQVLGNLALQPDGAWDAGWVYDPKVGKAYSVEIRLETRDQLTVTGYKGIKMLGKTFVWKRAPPTLPRCASLP